jgi:hypothetical protein
LRDVTKLITTLSTRAAALARTLFQTAFGPLLIAPCGLAYLEHGLLKYECNVWYF